MRPPQVKELVVLELMYLKELDPKNPVYLTRKRRSSKGFKPQVQPWFEQTMQKEQFSNPHDMKIRYSQWRILSGAVELFTPYEYQYNNVILILGEENIYWSYYDSKSIENCFEGCSELVNSYCNCCFQDQYLSIMDSVKKYVISTGGK